MDNTFRGLRVDGKGWVYGDLLQNYIHHKSGATIQQGGCVVYEVIPETVGRYLVNKNGFNLYDGDIIKFWYFYNSRMSSEDCFGTEPQNSFMVYEEYLDQTEGTIFIKEGTPFVKYSKKGKIHETIFYVLLNELGNEVSDYYMFDDVGSVELFLETFDEDELKGIEPVFFNHEISEWDDNYGEMSDKFYIYIKNIVDQVSSKIEIVGNIHQLPIKVE
ncbi:hypothetical protein [Sphingobacterium faecium]|uniref:hypothetical protein n=1 Tax=Sphingobacterium faecium TaxID=34087 RepID=UPI00247AD0D4|nr:hypothetical protein [Sphingobacterium faecium]WGQ15599.1 hypothetical protein QG727_04135 [Sphingobacterium faecium]